MVPAMVTRDANTRNVVEMPPANVRERTITGATGIGMAALCLLLLIAAIVLLVAKPGAVLIWTAVILLLAAVFLVRGLTAVTPGTAKVVQLFGRYIGTVRQPGLCWFNPLTARRAVSTRIRNHETAITKVNDADGNPIEIAAVLVWQVEDTARAVYEVDDFIQFVNIQAETAVRHIATSYPYDSHSETSAPATLSLRDNAGEITEKLSAEIADRVQSAGVHIVESRLTRLAYAPEIAQAMLRRQQASAVVAARRTIVEGAVGMVQLALDRLDADHVVELDEERKATMVSNLLVVLCGDRDTQPVVNTGSLYH
jgi:regulator of protease activity HflC (stomatin/prohibitin superfamily)